MTIQVMTATLKATFARHSQACSSPHPCILSSDGQRRGEGGGYSHGFRMWPSLAKTSAEPETANQKGEGAGGPPPDFHTIGKTTFFSGKGLRKKVLLKLRC